MISLIIIPCFLIGNINLANSEEPKLFFHPVKVNQKQLKCLAKNLFFEGRNTDFQEMIRLSNVVKNRVELDIYPETTCEVISQNKQFSWTSDSRNNISRINKLIKKDKKEAESWKMANYVAMLSLSNQLPDITHKAIAYHAVYMKKPHSSFWQKLKNTLTSSYHVYYTKIDS